MNNNIFTSGNCTIKQWDIRTFECKESIVETCRTVAKIRHTRHNKLIENHNIVRDVSVDSMPIIWYTNDLFYTSESGNTAFQLPVDCGKGLSFKIWKCSESRSRAKSARF